MSPMFFAHLLPSGRGQPLLLCQSKRAQHLVEPAVESRSALPGVTLRRVDPVSSMCRPCVFHVFPATCNLRMKAVARCELAVL